MDPDRKLPAYSIGRTKLPVNPISQCLAGMMLTMVMGLCFAAPPDDPNDSPDLAVLIDNLSPFERTDSAIMQAIRRSVGATGVSRGAPIVRSQTLNGERRTVVVDDGVVVGSWQGTVEVISVSPPDNPAERVSTGTTQVLLHRDGKPDELYFLNQIPPGLESGARATVEGYRRGNRVVATDVQVRRRQQ